MTNDDDVFGYQDGSEQLADYAQRFGLLVARLTVVRSVMQDVPFITDAEKERLLEPVSADIGRLIRQIGDLDDAFARRAEFSRQLCVVLTLELLRVSIVLTLRDVEIL